MRLPLRRMLALGLLCSAGALCADPRSGQWAHERSELVPQADVVWGKLDNGFRYALQPHQGVPGAATLQLLVLAGAMDEQDNERGLAHFMEHMAFRGNQAFPEEEMVRFFQELGIEFGSDINAVTSFDHTAYTLDFREATPPLLQRGLELFRSFADDVEFRPDLLEQERGVILSELRGRDSISAKGMQDSMEEVFEGLTFIRRTPGGSYESVKSLTREQFAAFYRRYYRPDLMVLVGAGDFDPAELVERAEAVFGSIPRPDQPLPSRDLGELRSGSDLRAATYRISDVGGAQLVMASPETPAREPDSRAARVARFDARFAQGLFSMRLQRGLMGTPGGSADVEWLVGNRAALASINTNGERWPGHLRKLDALLRATHRDGFLADEVEQARRKQQRFVTLAADLVDQRDPHDVSEGLLQSIVADRVYVGPAEEMTWRLAWLRGLDVEQASEAFREIWDLDDLIVHLSGDIPAELKTSQILAEWAKSRKIKPDEVRWLAREEKSFAMKPWGDAGTVEQVGEVPEIGAKLYRLSNGVRLNLISTPHEPGVFQAVARVGSGLLDMPGNKPALKEFGLQTLLASGTAHYLANDLQAMVEQEFLAFDFGVDDHDAFTLQAAAETDHLDAFLGVVTEFLFKPKFGTYVHRSEKMKATLTRASSAMGMQEGMRDLTDHLFDGDARFMWGSFVDYVGLSRRDVERWLKQPFTRGYVEISIVGDINEEEALALATRTVGTLTPRAEEKKLRGPLKPLKLSAPPGFERIEFVGERHLALVRGYWPVEGELSDRDVAGLYLLATLLENEIRKEIRDELGLAYSPMADYEEYAGFSEFGMLVATVDCASESSTRIARIVEDIAVRLSRQGIDEGAFIGARGILSSQVRRAWRDNGFLLSQVMRAQERPAAVAEVQALHAGLIDEITQAEVEALARRVLNRRNTRTAALVPKQFIGIFQTE